MTQRSLMFALTLCAGLIATSAAHAAAPTQAAPTKTAPKASPGRAPATFEDAAKAADTVKALDTKRFEVTTKNDLDSLASLLADDLVYVHSSATVDGKSAYIEALRSGRTRYNSIEPSDVSVRVYGNTAIVNGTAKLSVTTNGQTNAFSLRYTDVWVLRDNKWQMVSWHSTRLPQQ
jgi:ketosteroid isomerase-like protein